MSNIELERQILKKKQKLNEKIGEIRRGVDTCGNTQQDLERLTFIENTVNVALTVINKAKPVPCKKYIHR